MYLGIDIGSVSLKYVLYNEGVVKSGYYRTNGELINILRRVLSKIITEVTGIAVTGSGRKLVCAILSADLDIDEITAHRIAISKLYPNVNTIFEIGGQDSKLIYRTKRGFSFEMNTVCAAGTGAFLDQQAARMGLTIQEFCKKGMNAKKSYRIAGKCSVFAETDIIYAQQSGIFTNEIIRGINKALIDNYFGKLCSGKVLLSPFLFEGGTSENPLLVSELRQRLIEEKLIKNSNELIIPENNKLIGAIGAAMLLKTNKKRKIPRIGKVEFLRTEECRSCENKCGSKVNVMKIGNKTFKVGRICQ